MRNHLFLFYFVFSFLQLRGTDFSQQLQLAEDFRKASLFEASIKILNEIAGEEDVDLSTKKLVKKTLAKAKFQNEEYKSVIEIIDNEEDEELLLLKAMAFNQLNEFQEALSTLLKTSLKTSSAIYELAIAKFYLKDFLEAKPLFLSLVNLKAENLSLLAEMYLARIALFEGKSEKAAKNLESLLKKLPSDHLLFLEANYLQGKLFLEAHEYQKAVNAFQKALPTKETSIHILQEPIRALLKKSLENSEMDPISLSLENASFLSVNNSNRLYLNGLVEFKEGKRFLSQGLEEEASQAFFKAALHFNQAKKIAEDTKMIVLSQKFEAKSLSYQKKKESRLKALHILTSLTEKNQDFLNLLKDPGEIYYLQAFLYFTMNEELDEKSQELIELALQYKDSRYSNLTKDLLGSYYFKNKNYKEAGEVFLELEANYKENKNPQKELAAEALNKAIYSLAELPSEEETIRALRVRLYTEYPESKYAAESYFFCYSLQEYAEGSQTAIKHLQAFLKRFSKTWLLVDACYLLGLDCKRDRKSIEGKWIVKKNLSFAINYFQKVETYFEEFLQDELPKQEMMHYLTVRYLSALEKALANFRIAEDSLSGKQEIYFEYAKTAFKKIIEDFNDPLNPLAKMESYPRILEESSYWFGATCLKTKDVLLAKEIFMEMTHKYQSLAVTKGYFLSRTLYELGLIAISEKDPSLALEFLLKAEDASKGKILNSEQKLDLWIQQGLCFLELGMFDSAILLLSKTVNDDAVSQQRLKAMYLRAFVYEKQGRQELYKKQLEAVAKKGGEWGLKAKLKLEE